MDKRNAKERWLWENVGPPLYYCSECKLAVKVKPVKGGEPIINRPCDCDAQIIAPRKAVCLSQGTLEGRIPLHIRRQIIINRVKALLTGRDA